MQALFFVSVVFKYWSVAVEQEQPFAVICVAKLMV
jgi:hypothetical protein